jgi:hypothetical protein
VLDLPDLGGADHVLTGGDLWPGPLKGRRQAGPGCSTAIGQHSRAPSKERQNGRYGQIIR